MKLKTLAVMLAGALLLAACSQKQDVSAKKKAAAPAVAQNTLALDIQLPVFGEDAVWKSSDYKGKPVLVAVMATWCPWCKRSLKALDQTSEAYGGQVEVVGVFEGNDLDEITDVKDQYNIKSKILYDGRPVMEQLEVSGFPQIMLFDKNHKLVRTWSGYADNLADMYAEEIDKLFK